MEYEKKILKSENFSKQSLEGSSFSSCSFLSCNFTESNLRKAKFLSCIFSHCNFSLPKLDDCRFQDVRFIECKIVGAEFFKCERAFFSPTFEKSFLHYCNFSDLNMKGVSFKESKIQETNFNGTLLIGANFSECDLSGTNFHHCDLNKADFSNAKNYSIHPLTNKINKAKFSLPEVIGLLDGFDIIIQQ